MLKVVADEAAREDLAAGLDEIVQEGARRMLAAALEDEPRPTSRPRRDAGHRWQDRRESTHALVITLSLSGEPPARAAALSAGEKSFRDAKLVGLGAP